MAFGTGKNTGLNNTTKKEMRKLVDNGYTPQEISDRLNVVLNPCILSFYKEMTGFSDKEMEKYSTVDAQESSIISANEEAERILRKAREEAERIKAEALEDLHDAAEELEEELEED